MELTSFSWVPLLGAVSMWPFAVLAICIALIIFLITIMRVHAFIALIVVAFVAGLLTTAGNLPGDPAKSHWVRAIDLANSELGSTAGRIALVIGLASIISMCLMESGAADKVVRRFLAVFGEKRAGMALLGSTYVLSIPIFFDTMFMLMVPLAMALRLRTGKDYTLYVLAICCGGVVTHSLTVPHPGPLAMVDNLRVDVGRSLLAGILAGIPPCIAGWFVCKWLNRRFDGPLRETPAIPLSDLKNYMNKPESELPSFTFSILPVVGPIFLISIASFFEMVRQSAPAAPWASNFIVLCGGQAGFDNLRHLAEFIGNRNVALFAGALAAMALLVRRKNISLSQLGHLIGPPLETAAVIILITSAGGAFGLMLKHAGVGDAIKAAADGQNISLILLSYTVALVIRIAQGSATVAMLTTSAMIYPMMTDGTLPYNPLYIFLAIGFGAFGCSWMNDSGFWVVSRLSGFTERETLKTWTVMLTVVSIFGLIEVLILSTILPLPLTR